MRSAASLVGLALSIAVLLACAACAEEEVPAVRVAVQADWNESSLFYEVVEFLGELNNELVWSFVSAYGNSLKDAAAFQSAQEEYEHLITICTRLLEVDAKWLDLLEFALAARHFNARVASNAAMAQAAKNQARSAGQECGDADIVARLFWAKEYKYDIAAAAELITDEEIADELPSAMESTTQAGGSDDLESANVRLLKAGRARRDFKEWRMQQDGHEERFTETVCGAENISAKLHELTDECRGLPFKACWILRTMASIYPEMGDISSARSYGSRLTFVHVELFGDIRSEEFHTSLESLKEMATGRLVHVMLRSTPGQQPHDDEGNVFLQGWGAEMALKSTEYKAVDESGDKPNGDSEDDGDLDSDEWVEGISFSTLSTLYPSATADLRVLRKTLRAKSVEGDLRQLKRWEMTDLGKQAAYVASHSASPLKTLAELTGNFPSLAPSLSSVDVPNDYQGVLDAAGSLFRPGTSMGFINNRFIPDLSSFTTYDFLKMAIEEYKMAQDLRLSGIPDEHVTEVLKLPFEDIGRMRFNISEHIMWVNDIESEDRYNAWPATLQEILKPAWPGQLRFIRNNMMNVVIVLDPIEKASLEFFETLLQLVEGGAPFRFGVMMQTYPEFPDMFAFSPKSLRHLVAVAVQHVANELGPVEALKFGSSLSSYDIYTVEEALEALLDNVSAVVGQTIDEDGLLELEAHQQVLSRNEYLHSVMLASAVPHCFINGASYDCKLTMEGLTAVCQDAVQHDYPAIQRAVSKRQLNDGDSVFDFFVTGEDSFPGYDPLVVEAEPEYVNLACAPGNASPAEWAPLSFNSTLRAGIQSFFTTDMQWATELDVFTDVSHVLVVNPSLIQGTRQIHNILECHNFDDVFGGDRREARWCAIVVPPASEYNVDHSEVSGLYGDLYNVASASLPYKKRVRFLYKAFDSFTPGEISHRFDVGGTLNDLGIGNIRQNSFYANWGDGEYRPSAREIRRFAMTQLMDFIPGFNYIITNGRILSLPPLGRTSMEPFGYKLLEAMERRRNKPLIDYFKTHFVDSFSTTELNDMMLKTASILGSRQADRFKAPGRLNLREVRVKAEGALLDVRLLLDPLSKEARRIAPLLLEAQAVLGDAMSVHVEMNPIPDLSELPLSSYYRYAASSKVQFDESGSLDPAGALVSFEGLPVKPLFTLGIEGGDSWMLQQSVAKYDMDNIVLGNLEEDALALYSLEHLVVQGSCRDLDRSGAAPHTLELALKEFDGSSRADTVVMQNYGYFQLQATPGQFRIDFGSERSSEVYEFAKSALRGLDSPPLQHFTVAVDELSSRRERVTVRKRAGMQEVELTDVDISGSDDGTIHIFTVASGHLYERFLKIMILSSTKTASRPVKFWFLKNYLSPKFVASVAVLAEEYNFEYEFVTYQWPEWLIDQPEKQRKIWAYKILFLDVLFPLDVHRVIFVDADLIVRGDLAELTDMDLEGAPYAYTPFCSSREEMDGFRFWTQGFWKDHLAGRPYHISALYVIDLDQFRKSGAGDMVRAVYQGLAQDPNSLANLDQDLPNYMQAQVPIHSLPQEWLWCETWCNDDTKASAKAIDLCNNPLTKSPKLDNAVRIVEEWPALDREARDLEASHAEALQQAQPGPRLAAAAYAAGNRAWQQLAGSLEDFSPAARGGQPMPDQLVADQIL